MKIRVNGKDHALSFGPRVALPGSAVKEWQPHRPQGDRSAEWWNLTAVLRAASDLPVQVVNVGRPDQTSDEWRLPKHDASGLGRHATGPRAGAS